MGDHPLIPRRRLARAAAFAGQLAVPVVVLAILIRSETGGVVEFDRDAVTAATDFARTGRCCTPRCFVWEEATQARWINPRRGAGRPLGVAPANLGSRAAWAVATLLVAWGLANVVKYVVQRARPVIDEALGHSPGYSFPSGHSMNAMAAGIVLAVLLWPLLRTRARVVLTTAVASRRRPHRPRPGLRRCPLPVRRRRGLHAQGPPWWELLARPHRLASPHEGVP